jgi:hypothetical protein
VELVALSLRKGVRPPMIAWADAALRR